MMKTYIILLVGILMLINASAQTLDRSNQSAIKEKTDLIVRDLTNGIIKRVEILNVPERLLTRTSIKPEWIEKNYRYKLEIRDVTGSRKLQSLCTAIQNHAPNKPKTDYDLRWAFIFYNADSNKLHEIYYDAKKQGGIVDGQPVSFNENFKEWILSNYGVLFE